MPHHRTERWFPGQRNLIPTVFEHRLDVPIPDQVQFQGSGTGLIHPLIAIALAQPDQSQAGTESMFDEGTGSHDLTGRFAAIRTDGSGPIQNALGSPLQVLLMGRWTVFQNRRMAFGVATAVGGHPL